MRIAAASPEACQAAVAQTGEPVHGCDRGGQVLPSTGAVSARRRLLPHSGDRTNRFAGNGPQPHALAAAMAASGSQ